MKDSEELFQLIQSLSGPEKRYFKLMSSAYSGNKHYLQVFDLMVKQTTYNEEKLRKKIKDKVILKQLPSIKNYLYQLILKSISSFHSDSSEKSRLKNQISQAEHLISMGLIKHAQKLILRSKKAAYNIEAYSLLLEILKLEKEIFSAKSEYEHVSKVHSEIEKILNHLRIIKEYEVLRDNLFALFLKEGIARSEKVVKQIENIMKHPLLQDKSNALNFESKYNFYQTHSLYCELKGDFNACYSHRKALVNLLESEPFRINENQWKYISALNNLMIVLRFVKKFDEIKIHLDSMRALKPTSLINKRSIFLLSYISELNTCRIIGEFEKGVQLEAKINEGLKEFKWEGSSTTELSFYINLSILYFGSGNYSKSLRLLNKTTDVPGAEGRKNMQAFIRIYSLIIHYELNNEQLLPHLLRSTYRYLLKQQIVYQFETVMIQFIRKLPRLFSPKKIKDAYVELKATLEKLQNDPFEKHAFGSFDIISWLESKIEKRSFADCVRQRAASAAD
ncbi:MAG: hypothetical protein ACT4ON_10700 [Bacteroidota bacterium]